MKQSITESTTSIFPKFHSDKIHLLNFCLYYINVANCIYQNTYVLLFAIIS